MLQTARDEPQALLTQRDTFAQDRAHAIWRRLRREEPVAWTAPVPRSGGRTPIPGFWNVVRYEDVLAVSRDPATFISSKGVEMFTDPEDAPPAAGLGKMLIVTDPPRHVRLRRLVNKGFTPRAVAAFEPHIRGVTTTILDDLGGREAGDFVTEVAALLPLAVICAMMGIPEDDWNEMFRLTNTVLGAGDPEYRAAGASAYETAAAGHGEMFQYLARLVAERRAERRDDLVSLLVDSEIDGEQLSEEEILWFCFLLILAGNETTRNAISGGLLALFEHPEQRERLARSPDLLPIAIEEMLRWTTPAMHMVRTAVRDTAVGGQPVAAGERVMLWYPSANRDEAIFPDADTFDVGRTPNEHLAFGLGEHFCLGAGFARLEMRVMFEELFERLPAIEQAGPAERLRSTQINGIKHLPVHYGRARR